MTFGELCFIFFYLVLSFYTISSLIYFSKDFFSRFSPIFHITLYTNMMISLYLLLTLRKKPGKIEKSPAKIQSRLDITDTDQIQKEDITNLTITDSESSHTRITKTQEELSELNTDLNQYCKICDLIIVK
jgi:hypothetical protein